MELYLIVLFFVIVISFITGFILYIYNNIVLKYHVKKVNDNVNMGKTIRLDAINNFGFLLNANHNQSVEINFEPVISKKNDNNPPIPMPIINEDSIEQDFDVL